MAFTSVASMVRPASGGLRLPAGLASAPEAASRRTACPEPAARQIIERIIARMRRERLDPSKKGMA